MRRIALEAGCGLVTKRFKFGLRTAVAAVWGKFSRLRELTGRLRESVTLNADQQSRGNKSARWNILEIQKSVDSSDIASMGAGYCILFTRPRSRIAEIVASL